MHISIYIQYILVVMTSYCSCINKRFIQVLMFKENVK